MTRRRVREVLLGLAVGVHFGMIFAVATSFRLYTCCGDQVRVADVKYTDGAHRYFVSGWWYLMGGPPGFVTRSVDSLEVEQIRRGAGDMRLVQSRSHLERRK